MHILKKTIVPIFLATLWIAFSEFVRNSVFLHGYWVTHYQGLGLTFPEQPINGAVWGLWSLCFAVFLYIVRSRFSLLHTTLLAWFVGFVCMWLVVGNLGVLPFAILPFAIPLSFLEVYVATLVIRFNFGETKTS